MGEDIIIWKIVFEILGMFVKFLTNSTGLKIRKMRMSHKMVRPGRNFEDCQRRRKACFYARIYRRVTTAYGDQYPMEHRNIIFSDDLISGGI